MKNHFLKGRISEKKLEDLNWFIYAKKKQKKNKKSKEMGSWKLRRKYEK